jgi:hypothetical protein
MTHPHTNHKRKRTKIPTQNNKPGKAHTHTLSLSLTHTHTHTQNIQETTVSFCPFAFVICVRVCHFLPPVFSGFKCLCMCVYRFVTLWFVIWSFCDLYVDVLLFALFRLLVFFVYNFCFLVLRHQTMNKVHKHNSINTNIPSSESYRMCFMLI